MIWPADAMHRATEILREVSKLLAIAITTIEFVPDDQRTRPKVSVPIAGFCR